MPIPPVPPALIPWLQRLVVAVAGSVVTGGVVLATADNRFAPKKRKRRRGRRRVTGKTAPPILLGTVAKADAGEAYVPSLTWAQWRDAVAARGRGIFRFVTGQPKEGSVDKDGARIPDEIRTKDGARRRSQAGRSSSKTRRRRGERRKEASLFDSAKESLRQVVKDEAKKAVDEKVEEAALKKAADALKGASGKVSETAKDVASKVKESLPEDLDEKAKLAGRTVLSGAKSAFGKLAASLNELAESSPVEPLSVAPPPPIEAAPPAEALSSAAATDLVVSEPITADVEQEGTKDPVDAASDGARVDGAPASAVATAVGDGVQRLGSFLSGPGNPGYQKQSSRRMASGDDIVEAKDGPTC